MPCPARYVDIPSPGKALHRCTRSCTLYVIPHPTCLRLHPFSKWVAQAGRWKFQKSRHPHHWSCRNAKQAPSGGHRPGRSPNSLHPARLLRQAGTISQYIAPSRAVSATTARRGEAGRGRQGKGRSTCRPAVLPQRSVLRWAAQRKPGSRFTGRDPLSQARADSACCHALNLAEQAESVPRSRRMRGIGVRPAWVTAPLCCRERNA